MPRNSLSSRKLLTIANLAGLIGLVFVIAIVMTRDDSSDFDLLSEIPVFAEGMAHGEEGSVLATAPLDDELDGLYFFDGKTGELTVVALNNREFRFMAVLRKNVANDFFGKDKNKTKNPKFMMSVGGTDLVQRPGSQLRWGDSVIFLLERTTGRVVCYGTLLPPNLKANKEVYRGSLEVVSKLEIREVEVRGGG